MIQPFILMVIFASCRIYMFMKININIWKKKKIAEKWIWYTYKITNI